MRQQREGVSVREDGGPSARDSWLRGCTQPVAGYLDGYTMLLKMKLVEKTKCNPKERLPWYIAIQLQIKRLQV